MILQWIIIGAIVTVALVVIIRRIILAIRTRGCGACSASKSSEFYKMISGKNHN